MLSPRREHHLQLTKITTIGNSVLVCTRTLILKHMLSWRREQHSQGRLFNTCWSSWGRNWKRSRKPKRYKCEDHWNSQNHRYNFKTNTIIPRFQDQWVAKTIEKTNTHKTTKISGSMIRVHDHGSWNLVLFVVWVYRWLWLPIDPEILVVLFLLVFSMVLAIHWFWNLGCLVVLVFSMVLDTHWFWNIGALSVCWFSRWLY